MPTEVLPNPRAVTFDAFLNELGALRRLRWQSAYQALAPDWVTWDELDLLTLVDSIEVDWTRTPVYKPVEDGDLPDERADANHRRLMTSDSSSSFVFSVLVT